MATKIPRYCKHKASGQAYVTLKGKFHYLGEHGTAESVERYARLVAEAQLNGGIVAPKMDERPSVRDLVGAHAVSCVEQYGHLPYEFGRAGVELKLLCGSRPAAEFTPLDLLTLRGRIANTGRLSVTTVNKVTAAVKRMFRWAVSRNMVPADTWMALTSVEGLKRNHRTAAKPPRRILPVAWESVEPVLPHLPRPVREVVLLLWHTGARPSEILGLRAGDVDTTLDPWRALLADHKTAHAGRERVLHFGPAAQAVLRPVLLRRQAGQYLFDPHEQLLERTERAATHRRPNQLPSPRKTDRQVGDRYDSLAVLAAVRRGIGTANALKAQALGRPLEPHETLPAWTLYQLRHSFATRTRAAFGIEAVKTALGHSNTNLAAVYAEQDRELAASVASRLG